MDYGDSTTTKRVARPAALTSWGEVALARGRTIGRYVVIEELGRGGMGVVYAAYDPELDRKVAIKLLHASRSATDQGREELLREAQAIASISHPNVVAVHDVGTFESRVFMAMEFLGGGTLRSHISRTDPEWRDVIRHFLAAARGLMAAHERGLVHRDFKPDNVLVADDGSVRVCDFGLVCAESTPPTRSGHSSDPGSGGTRRSSDDFVAGSPAYMSPEQYETIELDARSDQFSFCVALYEMLYRQRPYSATQPLQVRDQKRSGRISPPPADTTVPKRIRRAIEQGLQPDRERRHPSMAALVRALDADATSTRRWVLGLGSAGVTATALLWAATRTDAGPCTGAEAKLVGTWDDDVRAQVHAGLLAASTTDGEDVAARVERTLDEYATSWATMHREACEATRLRGDQSEVMLDRRMSCLGDRLRDVRALAEVLSSADRATAARAVDATHELPALAACEADRMVDDVDPRMSDPAAIAVVDELARARARLATGQVKLALAIAETTVADARKLGIDALLADALYLRGQCESSSGRFAESIGDYREAVLFANAAKHDELAALAHIAIVAAAARSGSIAEAETALRFAESAVDRVGAPPAMAASLLESRGVLRSVQGQHADALAAYRRALEIEESVPEPSPTRIATQWHSIADVLSSRGQLDEALEAFTRVRAIREGVLGPKHPALADVASHIGSVLLRQGRLDEAQAMIEGALATRTMAYGEESTAVAESLNQLATLHSARGQWEEAEARFEDSRRVSVKVLGPKHPGVAHALNNLAMCAHHRGDLAKAAEHMDAVLDIYVTTYGPRHPLVALALGNMAELAQERGDVEGAHELATRSVTTFRAIDDGKSRYFPPVLALLGDLETARGHKEEARASYREVLAIADRTKGVDEATLTKARCGLDPSRVGCKQADG
jgi:tetratricopeptide (TPR) repeat protein